MLNFLKIRPGSLFCQVRTLQKSAKNDFLVERRPNDPFAILQLNASPVNSFNLERLQALNLQLDKLENDAHLKGVILTSSVNGVFSSGVDVLEMYKCDPTRLGQFWNLVQDFWLKLYGSKKIYIAAINGHALALGCVVAMCCDYRIMVDNDRLQIGIMATHLGKNPPSWICDLMVATIGQREAEMALQLGKKYTPKKALALNLVDKIVETPDLTDNKALMTVACEEMTKWCQIPTLARQLTKERVRSDRLNKFVNGRDKDLEVFIEATMDPEFQQNLEKYLNFMKNKKFKK